MLSKYAKGIFDTTQSTAVVAQWIRAFTPQGGRLGVRTPSAT